MEVHKSAQEVYKRRVVAPHKDSVNTGLSYLRPATCRKLLGEPRLKKDYTDDYQDTDNPTLQALMVTQEVTGLGRVRGLKPAVDSLNRVMKRVRLENPNLLSVLSSGGMLNVRRIRGTKDTPSNHAWGCAIDIKVGGLYDTPGDGKCFIALLELYPYFYAEGWFWGTEFSREDSMHFEVANETLPKMLGEFGAVAEVEAKVEAVAESDAKTVKAVVSKAPASPKKDSTVEKVVEQLKTLDRAGLRHYLTIEGVPFNTRTIKDELLKMAIKNARGK